MHPRIGRAVTGSHGEPRPRLLDRRRLVDRTLALLATHFREPLLLEDVALAVGCSKFHLARVFRRQTNCTLHQWILRLRLEAAWVALHGGRSADLTDLALELGFSSHSHFTKAFRERYGMPPSRVRDSVAASVLGPTAVARELTQR